MFDAHRRPWGRLFYLLAIVLALPGALWSQTPATTTVSDFVYRADGSLAGGTLFDLVADFQHGWGTDCSGGKKECDFGAGRHIVGSSGPKHERGTGQIFLHSGVPT